MIRTSLPLLFLITFISIQVNAQEENIFRQHEDSLAKMSVVVGTDTVEANREETVYRLIPYLVEVLKKPNSFEYPFDSVPGISFEYAPDKAFRLITFQLKKDDGSNRYYGAIQFSSDQDLKLIPLFDVSDTLNFHTNEVLGSSNWYGAIYYNILMHEVKGKKYYTLFGFDANDYWSNKKFLEILTFEGGQPVFGAPLIAVTDSLGNTEIFNRFFIEYKHDSKVSMNYSPEEEIIVYDRLKPHKKKYEGLFFTYIPDGSYEGFKWKNGRWNWVKKVFHYSIGHRDNPPVPVPILDEEEEKLYDPRSGEVDN